MSTARTRAQGDAARGRWTRALEMAAGEAGKDSRLYRVLHSLAWGRFEGESKPDEKVMDVFEGLGYLRGYRDALIFAAREAEWPEVDRAMCEIPQRVREMERKP